MMLEIASVRDGYPLTAKSAYAQPSVPSQWPPL
jgi:hypothetical protein